MSVSTSRRHLASPVMKAAMTPRIIKNWYHTVHQAIPNMREHEPGPKYPKVAYLVYPRLLQCACTALTPAISSTQEMACSPMMPRKKVGPMCIVSLTGLRSQGAAGQLPVGRARLEKSRSKELPEVQGDQRLPLFDRRNKDRKRASRPTGATRTTR